MERVDDLLKKLAKSDEFLGQGKLKAGALIGGLLSSASIDFLDEAFHEFEDMYKEDPSMSAPQFEALKSALQSVQDATEASLAKRRGKKGGKKHGGVLSVKDSKKLGKIKDDLVSALNDVDPNGIDIAMEELKKFLEDQKRLRDRANRELRATLKAGREA